MTTGVSLTRQVKRRFRLTSSNDFMRVRRMGKSYAHPFVVLVALPSELEQSRFAITAGRRVGNAVKRNRAKRLLREAVRSQLEMISPGWDIILIARQPLLEADSHQVRDAVVTLLKRSQLMDVTNDE